MDGIQSSLAALLEETQSLVAVYDPRDILRHANGAFRKAYHVAEGEEISWADMMRRNHALGRGAVIDAPDFEAWLVSSLSRRGKVPHRAFETDLADGRWMWVVETMLADGWSLFLASDVTDLRASERDLRKGRDRAIREAETDSLTGISNRRYMMQALDRLLTTPSEGRTDSVCLIDIDHFKTINDRFGHEVGDAVLVDFAHQMRNGVRPVDAFGRIGGEEFMLILPGLAAEEAEHYVEIILDGIKDRAFTGSGMTVSYTVSAGVTQRGPDDTARSIYARSDQALYDAKQAGRNRIEIAAHGPMAGPRRNPASA